MQNDDKNKIKTKFRYYNTIQCIRFAIKLNATHVRQITILFFIFDRTHYEKNQTHILKAKKKKQKIYKMREKSR